VEPEPADEGPPGEGMFLLRFAFAFLRTGWPDCGGGGLAGGVTSVLPKLGAAHAAPWLSS
jgi:hypothetical protein